jgi:hypothetical protein
MQAKLFSPARKVLLAAAAALFSLAAAQIQAQPDPPMQAGRLSYVSGTVSYQPAGLDDWGAAQMNLPLGPGDRIFTDSDGRAEVQIGYNYIRIGPNTDVSIVEDDPNGISIGVAQGSVHVNSHGVIAGQPVYVNTPSGSITFKMAGEARVDVMPQQGAAIFTGLANDQFVTGAGGFSVGFSQGQTLELVGTNPVMPQYLDMAAPDALDVWSQQRDQQIMAAASWRYVSPDVPGTDELDANGSWMPGTPYGAVWFPRVAAGWAPYHYGHWVNHAPWGPVWVEDESWGYAPFHYGRWVMFEGRWGWVPGQRTAHPVWSPALVVFAGGIQVGGVAVSAWFPLGPGEPYHPWYPCSPHYVDVVNITNIAPAPQVHVLTTYVGFNFGGIAFVNRTTGVTAISQADFAAGRPVRETNVVVNVNVVQHITVIDRPVVQVNQRTVIERAPARPVPVAAARPTMIDAKGMVVSSKPGFQPVAPPVRPVTQVTTLPGRKVIAPPPGVKLPPAAAAMPARTTPPGQNAPGQNTPGQNAPGQNTQGQDNRPTTGNTGRVPPPPGNVTAKPVQNNTEAPARNVQTMPPAGQPKTPPPAAQPTEKTGAATPKGPQNGEKPNGQGSGQGQAQGQGEGHGQGQNGGKPEGNKGNNKDDKKDDKKGDKSDQDK